MSRRSSITLSASEQQKLLDTERTVMVSTLGPRGWPHSMPLWYVPRDGEVWIYTYGKSQKVVNLERDPRATARKRVAIRFAAKRVVSWDHRKLGGKY